MHFGDINLKNKKNIAILVTFVVLLIASILVGIFVLNQPVVLVCVVLLLHVAIAGCLNDNEIWIHAVVLLIVLIAAVLISQILLEVVGAVLYIITLLALKFLEKDDDLDGTFFDR